MPCSHLPSRRQLATPAKCAAVLCALALGAGQAHAQGEPSTAELAKQLTNPVAALIQVPAQANYDSNMGPLREGSRTTVNLQPVVPISLNSEWNLISRTIIPLIDQHDVTPTSGHQSGVGDVLQSLFFSPVKPTDSGWIWGIGPVFLLPTGNSEFSADKWGLGPTGVALRQDGPWTYGMLANHVWSTGGSGVNDVSSTFLQPFLSYTTPTAWSFTTQMEATYDWERSQWSVPAGFLVGKVTKVGSQLINITAGPRYYLAHADNGPQGWGFRFQLSLLFPK